MKLYSSSIMLFLKNQDYFLNGEGCVWECVFLENTWKKINATSVDELPLCRKNLFLSGFEDEPGWGW